MPLIPESNALMLAQNFDSLDTERQAKAREILRQYRDQQDELGLPEWPSQSAAEQESKTRLRGFFEDLKTVDAAAPSLASVLPYSKNPDADRARVANTAYMASRYGKTADEIGGMYDLYRDDLAARIGGKPGLDDLAFHSVLKGEVEKEKRKEQSFQSGAVSAVSGKSALVALAEWQAANPDAKDDTPLFMQAFTTASSRIRPHLPMVKEIADAIEADMNGKGDAKVMQALSERLIEMSGKERRMVIAGLRMEAENRGKITAGQKGGMLGGNFWQQVGESAGRFVMGGLSGTSNMKLADGLKSIPETGSVVWTGGVIDTPEKAREFVSGELSRSMSEQVQTAFADNPPPLFRDGQEVSLDAKATNLIREAKARVEKRIRVAQEMAALGSEIDPLPSVVASTLGTSGALLGGAILTRGMSAPMAAQLYAGTEYEEMSRKFPMMGEADKQGIAALSGSLQAGLDLVGVKGLDKLPAVQTLLKQGLTRTIAGRAAGQFGKSFAVENLVEGAQDIATPTIMAALASDVPGYDWNSEAQNWWKNRADVAIGLLPLTLLGVGAVSARDALGAQSLLGWDLKLASAGVLAADRTKITDLARNGDVEGAQAVLKEAWSRRSPKEASEFQAKIAARDAEAQAAFEEAARIGLLPTIRRDSSGYTVTNNAGESVSFGSWQDARDAASEGMTDVERSGIDAIAAMADHFLKSNPNEVFEFKPGESMTLKGRVASGELSAEEATHAAIVAGQLDGMTKEEAQNATWTVLGNNRVELAENVRRSVSTIFNGGNVLTAVEEPVEGRWKAGIASGRYTREGGIEWVRLAEQATGEKFLPDGDISDRALIEAISKIVVADVFGRRKDGSRIAPGAVTMGVKSSLQQSAAARGLSAFLRAFRAFFGQVFKVARALAKARKDGKLSADWESQLDELLGIDSQQQHETEAAKEADAIANEALYAGGSSYSETNPGPNGETFSIGRVKNGGRLLTFEKPIETPLGRVVSYEWQSELVEDVDKEGEAVLKRVSDWDKAVANAETGRAIVHHFTVVQPDGSQKTVSLESALKATKGTDTGKALASAVKAARRLPLREAELVELEKLHSDYMAAIEDAETRGWRNAPEPELRTPEFPPLAERGVKAVYIGNQFIKNLEPNESVSRLETMFGRNFGEAEWKKQWAKDQIQRPPYGTLDRIQLLKRLIKKDKATIDGASVFSSRAIAEGSETFSVTNEPSPGGLSEAESIRFDKFSKEWAGAPPYAKELLLQTMRGWAEGGNNRGKEISTIVDPIAGLFPKKQRERISGLLTAHANSAAAIYNDAGGRIHLEQGVSKKLLTWADRVWRFFAIGSSLAPPHKLKEKIAKTGSRYYSDASGRMIFRLSDHRGGMWDGNAFISSKLGEDAPFDLRPLPDEDFHQLARRILRYAALNDEATKVSQGGFQKQESSEASAFGGTWPQNTEPTPPEVNSFNPSRAEGGESFNLRKFDFSSRLAPAAETLAKMRQGGKAFDFASIYKAASVGQSSSMLPLSRLFDAAKKQNPALTEADFGKQIQALYDSGGLMLEPGESPDSMRESLARFGVRDSLGVPAMFAGALNEFGRAIPADASKQTIMPDGARLVGPTTFSIAEYGGNHRPNNEGPRAFDLLEGGISPSDVYQHPEWYSAMETKVIRETMAQLRKVKGNPQAKLTIYRAGPKGEMNTGDWVSLSKEYARTHAESQDPEGFKVWQAQVAADSVRWSLDDLAEFGYFGEQVAASDTGETFSIRAYHGTPHKVDKFSLDKIGTGEGAQAYGWGLYFAENAEVASGYKDKLARVTGFISLKNGDLIGDWNQPLFDQILDLRNDLYSAGDGAEFDAKYETQFEGNLYTVELLPDADEFLDWDKPLSEQSEKVKAAIQKAKDAMGDSRDWSSWSGMNIHAAMELFSKKQFGEFRSDAVSKSLASLGIPGIRYADGQSRVSPLEVRARKAEVSARKSDAEANPSEANQNALRYAEQALADLIRKDREGTRNYVIFDENLVRILEENGKPVESFSIRPGNFASRMDAAFSPFQRSPELRMAIAQVAKQRAQRLGAEWIEKAAVLRSARDIGREQRFREADGFDRRMQAYLDSLTPSARQELEFEPAELENDPLVAAMLDFGKLMSQSTAKKLGKMEAKAGDYDGAPWLPPAWYSKGSGIMPDVMAQAMHDQGLLPDASTDALWNALSSRIESTRKNKTAHREAVKAYQDAKKAAKADAKLEAEAWANQARKEAGSPKAQRDMLKAALRTLDGILSAAPAAVRVKVGGYVKMAGLATDETMLDEIERRIEKLNTELEKWLKKEAASEIRSLLKQGRPDMSAGKKGKGKDADMHTLLAAAEAAADMDALAVAGRLADLDTRIASSELTPEQEALAMAERGIVELVGDLDNADSGRAFSALDSLREIYTGGWLKWKLAEIERKERRAGMRQDFIEATGKSGVGKERDAADKQAKTLLGMAKAKWLSLSSFGDVLRYNFGEGPLTDSLIDGERGSSNRYEDANQKLADEVEELFSSIAGTRLAGERLRFDMAQKSIITDKRDLSQLEAIQALLMWRQEDGRRHMEGTRDENGKVTSAWSYDQAWVDEVDSKLTPEARRVMGWLVMKYGSEYEALNALYRMRYGVNMPRHDNYAPITVKPMTTKAGEVVDPVTGATTSSGSILTPGSLRTRSRSAIAEPDFRDALQTFLGHSRQLEFWKAYYDLAVEANAVLGNREVMNAVHAKGGSEAATALRQWIDAIAQGGFRDVSARLDLMRGVGRVIGRASGVALLGRVSALLVQSTQLAAASVQMPVTAYLTRFARLFTGGLNWGDAIRSDFIQRRFKIAPPIVRQAMDGLASARPNAVMGITRTLGNTLSGADALFTAGTYAMLLDFHRSQGAATGLSGAELEAYATREAERATEQVAQPTRMTNRSLAEITSTHPLGRIGWAFASESRQKVALAGWALANAGKDPARAAKAVFLTFIVGGMLSQIIKNALRELKGDDDKNLWSPERLAYAATVAPMASAFPLGSLALGDSNMLSNIQRASKSLDDGEVDFRDIDTILSAAGLFSDTAAGLAQLSHLGMDAAKILQNLAE